VAELVLVERADTSTDCGLEDGIIAEHLLNNRLQTRASSANQRVVTLTKQTNLDQCEQVRVN